MTEKSKKQGGLPSSAKDAFRALSIAFFVIIIYALVYFAFGNNNQLSNNVTLFIGAILTISGLVTQQYQKEDIIALLTQFSRLNKIIAEITKNDIFKEQQSLKIKTLLKTEYNKTMAYEKYIATELKAIPIIQLSLIIFYGMAMIANESGLFRAICLLIMFSLVSYLAMATITSNNIAIDKHTLDQELDQIISEYENFLNSVNNSNSKPII